MARKQFEPTYGNIVGIGLLVALTIFSLGGHLWRDASIAFYGQKAQGTVTGENRGAILYHYAVDGHEYSGSDVGDTRRPYPVGTAVEVHYSAAYPSFSTIDAPFLFEEQAICGVSMFGGLFLIVYLGRRYGKPPKLSPNQLPP
jgi:hypothetical protein